MASFFKYRHTTPLRVKWSMCGKCVRFRVTMQMYSTMGVPSTHTLLHACPLCELQLP